MADAAARAAATLASNAWSASGALALNRAGFSGQKCGVARTDATADAAHRLKCAADVLQLDRLVEAQHDHRRPIEATARPVPMGLQQPRRGVVNVKEYGRSSRRPLSAAAEASILTSYFVASGSLRAA